MLCKQIIYISDLYMFTVWLLGMLLEGLECSNTSLLKSLRTDCQNSPQDFPLYP